MVREANVKAAAAEKALTEARMQVCFVLWFSLLVWILTVDLS